MVKEIQIFSNAPHELEEKWKEIHRVNLESPMFYIIKSVHGAQAISVILVSVATLLTYGAALILMNDCFCSALHPAL